jgi:hypothetical protein
MSTTTTTTKPSPSLPHLLPTFQALAVLPCTLKLFYITYSYFSVAPYNAAYYLTYHSPFLLSPLPSTPLTNPTQTMVPSSPRQHRRHLAREQESHHASE